MSHQKWAQHSQAKPYACRPAWHGLAVQSLWLSLALCKSKWHQAYSILRFCPLPAATACLSCLKCFTI